jgi:hypothetical protein
MRPQSVADGTILWYCRGENSAATREPIAILIALILGLVHVPFGCEHGKAYVVSEHQPILDTWGIIASVLPCFLVAFLHAKRRGQQQPGKAASRFSREAQPCLSAAPTCPAICAVRRA